MSDARLGLVLTVVGATAAGFGAAVLTHRWCVQQQQQRAAPPLPPRRHADGMRAVQRQALALMQTQRRAGALVAEARAHIDSAHAAAAAAPAQGPPYPALFASYVAMRPSDFADIRFVSTCKHFLLIATHFFCLFPSQNGGRCSHKRTFCSSNDDDDDDDDGSDSTAPQGLRQESPKHKNAFFGKHRHTHGHSHSRGNGNVQQRPSHASLCRNRLS